MQELSRYIDASGFEAVLYVDDDTYQIVRDVIAHEPERDFGAMVNIAHEQAELFGGEYYIEQHQAWH